MLVAPSKRFVVGSLLVGSLAVSLVGVSLASATFAARSAPPDPCAIAMDPNGLEAREKALVARHMLACSDVEHGRITAGEYRAELASIADAWTPPPPPPAPPAMQWASSVRAVSTQYTATSWAASRVLGAPDVFPQHGDNQNAWASLGADDRDEFLEVAFAQPVRASAVEIYETYNPGAVRSIEMITTSGQHIAIYQGAPSATGVSANRLRAETRCSSEPIAAVRVELGSTQVPGWNEIDAIGLVPCGNR